MAAQSTIQKIKKIHELEWLRVEGVEGVGISKIDGREVIVVYISGNKQMIEKQIPKKIDGCFIQLKETGEFAAF